MNPLTPEERTELKALLANATLRTAVQVVQNMHIPNGGIDEDILKLENVSGMERSALQFYRSSGVFIFWTTLAKLSIQDEVRSMRHPEAPKAFENAIDPDDLKRLEAKKRREEALEKSQGA